MKITSELERRILKELGYTEGIINKKHFSFYMSYSEFADIWKAFDLMVPTEAEIKSGKVIGVDMWRGGLVVECLD